MNEPTIETPPEESEPSGDSGYIGTSTYCPEDDCLRLYVGRVPRPLYERLRAEKWVSTPKQNCDFVVHWSPQRRDTALELTGFIEDEDQSPEERSADRAERFAGYREKRTYDAVGHADQYDSGPSAHGFQSQARAERAAARHDRVADRAGDAWGKAEYWQQRTAGVIGHALYKSTPGVRMGRIKTLEAELRKMRVSLEEYAKLYHDWQKIAEITDPEKQTKIALAYSGSRSGGSYNYQHPRDPERKTSLYCMLSSERDPITGKEACDLFFSRNSEPTQDTSWTLHYELRLAYENQMLEAQGGRAAHVEMVPGGWLGKRQIQKVNKSSVTGRVVSVQVWGTHTGFTRESGYKKEETRPCLVTIETERLAADAYRPPTPEELEAFNTAKKAAKAAAPKVETIPLINPTDADAERLQAIWNERGRAQRDAQEGSKYMVDFEPSTVCRITQERYSAASKGAYGRAETRGLSAAGELKAGESNMYSRERDERDKRIGPALCKIRITSSDSDQWPYVKRVIVLTDKPQKPLPTTVWPVAAPAAPKFELAFA